MFVLWNVCLSTVGEVLPTFDGWGGGPTLNREVPTLDGGYLPWTGGGVPILDRGGYPIPGQEGRGVLHPWTCPPTFDGGGGRYLL